MSSKQQEKSLRILASLHAINRALKRRARVQHGDSLGLLMVLSAVAAPGRARASDLADQLLVDLSSVSRRLSTLEARGLVERVVDSKDRRAQLIALTPAGRELLASLQKTAGSSMAEVLSHWTLRDLDLLAGLLTRLDSDLNAAEAAQPTASLALSMN